MEIVRCEHIEANVNNSNDWKHAIYLSGELLLRTGDITEAYIDAMISSVDELGPYIVISPGFALAHAQPSETVLHNSISLISLATPVEFHSKNDPVRIVMCIACRDRNAHMASLQRVAKQLLTPGIIENLSKAKTKEELYELINAERE